MEMPGRAVPRALLKILESSSPFIGPLSVFRA